MRHPIRIGERGLRYLKDLPHHNRLKDFVSTKLHQLSMDDAIKWYIEAYPRMTDDMRAYVGCNDRYFLMVMVLKRHDILHPWLYARCRQVEEDPDGHIDLWARYHFKSSIITQAGSIQEILINPNIRIAIFSNTQPSARRFLRQIKQTFETNGLLKRVYSDVLYNDPRKQSPVWGIGEGLVVQRDSTPKEPTISAYSVLKAMPVGSHFDLLVWDDLITKANVTNEDQIRATTEGFELSTNLGVGENTRHQMIGTRYSFADSYGILIKRGIFTPRLFPATSNGKLTGNPVLMTPAGWEKIKKQQRSTVAAQMLQNPLAGSENTFEVEWFRPYHLRPTILNVYIMADPSRGARGLHSDRTAMAVVGQDIQGNRYLLDGMCHRMKLKERWDALKMLHKKWSTAIGVQACVVGYERYGMQSDDEVFEEWMRRDKYYFSISELSWPREGAHSKKDRVERLEPAFRGSNFWLPSLIWDEDKSCVCTWKIEDSQIHMRPYDEKSPPRKIQAAIDARQEWRIAKAIRRKNEDGEWYDVTKSLMDEMLLFPVGQHDDMVDALSRIYDIEATSPRKTDPALEKFYADT